MPSGEIPNDESFHPEAPGARQPVGEAPPMSREETIEHTLRMMMLRGLGRFDELAKFMTEDCEMYFPGLPGQSPFTGTFRGKQECLKAMKANFTLIEFLNLRAKSVIVEGDSVVVNWICDMRNRGTGPAIPVEGMARVRLRGRMMTFYGNYLDTAAVGALAEFPPPKV